MARETKCKGIFNRLGSGGPQAAPLASLRSILSLEARLLVRGVLRVLERVGRVVVVARVRDGRVVGGVHQELRGVTELGRHRSTSMNRPGWAAFHPRL